MWSTFYELYIRTACSLSNKISKQRRKQGNGQRKNETRRISRNLYTDGAWQRQTETCMPNPETKENKKSTARYFFWFASTENWFASSTVTCFFHTRAFQIVNCSPFSFKTDRLRNILHNQPTNLRRHKGHLRFLFPSFENLTRSWCTALNYDLNLYTCNINCFKLSKYTREVCRSKKIGFFCCSCQKNRRFIR